MGQVKQGCPLLLTQFDLCTNELEHIVAKFIKEEGIDEVTIGNVVIVLLLYVYGVVFLVKTTGNVQKLMWALE
mgnify:CR=1 FL=1